MSRYLAIALFAFTGCLPMFVGCDASVKQIDATDGEAAAPANMDKAREEQMAKGREMHGEE